MTYTYNPPAGTEFATDVDYVRFLIGDTKGEQPWSLQDEEIQFLLGIEDGDQYLAAALAAEQIGGSYSGSGAVSKTVGNTSINRTYSGEADRWNAKAAWLRDRRRTLQASSGGAGMGLVDGGSSERIFSIGMLDNPPYSRTEVRDARRG